MIADTIVRLRRELDLPVDPTRRGPVLLNRFFEESSLSHVALPGLTIGSVAAHLLACGVRIDEAADPATPLAGFLFFAGRVGLAFVNAADILQRRRFTAAHELGHAVLHREAMGRFIADPTISEGGDATTEMEREANRFAAELLMPAEVIQARAEELQRDHGACPVAVLEYRLAAELLVSGEAIRYRLKALGVCDG